MEMEPGQLMWCLGGVFRISSVHPYRDPHISRMMAFGTYLNTTTGETEFREDMYRNHLFKEVSETDRKRLLRQTRRKGFPEEARDVLFKRNRG